MIDRIMAAKLFLYEINIISLNVYISSYFILVKKNKR